MFSPDSPFITTLLALESTFVLSAESGDKLRKSTDVTNYGDLTDGQIKQDF